MTPPLKPFTDLAVWRRSHQLLLDLAKDLDPFPRKPRLAIMTDQILGRIGSEGATIAERFNRSQKKSLNSSLDIAFGEAAETENWLY
ncbi:MAG: four helix bundle protein, partial [Planctomycetota bacterium]